MRNFIASLMVLCPLLNGCSKDVQQGSSEENGDYIPKEITILPEKEVKVYWGMQGKWHEWTNQESWKHWNYVRNNLTGFYTNFIDMWVMHYQNRQETAAETCKKLYNTFTNKSCFFETSMEDKVNTGVNGFNDERSDKRSLDYLVDAGFSVDYTSMNYLSLQPKEECLRRIDIVRTYKGNRKCMSLHAPWRYGGNIAIDATTANAQAREWASWCDGMETDGPLGFWVSDRDKMKEGSYSVVKYAEFLEKESAIMLAPYGAGVPGYDLMTDFLKVAKQCVMDHEDNEANPDLWVLWLYQGGNLPQFPECEKDEYGNINTVNTATGVAFWVLKHFKEFPVLKANIGGNTKDDNLITVNVKKGSYVDVPIEVSNGNLPAVELSPVIRAIVDKDNPNWNFSFEIDGTDYTDDFIYNGGMNFIKEYRLTENKKITIDLRIKYNGGDTKNNTIKFEVMSNISNTKNKKEMLTINTVGE